MWYVRKNKSRILVAEDEVLLRSIMVRTLTKQGFDVLEAADGFQAIDLLTYPDHVDAVVTDIDMPGMDGVEVAQHAHEKHPDLPIIFASSLANDPNLPEPCGRLVKPYSREQLVNKVKTALEQ